MGAVVLQLGAEIDIASSKDVADAARNLGNQLAGPAFPVPRRLLAGTKATTTYTYLYFAPVPQNHYYEVMQFSITGVDPFTAPGGAPTVYSFIASAGLQFQDGAATPDSVPTMLDPPAAVPNISTFSSGQCILLEGERLALSVKGANANVLFFANALVRDYELGFSWPSQTTFNRTAPNPTGRIT